MHSINPIPVILLFLSLSLPMAAPLTAQQLQRSYILYVGESGGALHDGIQALTRADELADMRIRFLSMLPSSTLHARYIKDFGLSPNSQWALAAHTGSTSFRCLVQGTELPTVGDIQNAFEQVGMKSPIRTLRDFLKRHPDHLDARMQLLKILREIAEDRTRQTLKLEIKPLREEEDFSRFLNTSIVVDTSTLDGKKLTPEQDILIWGSYAQELQTLFSSGDWKLVSLPWVREQIPVEVCSPTMIQIYRWHIQKVEAYLEDYPTNTRLWETYGWMASLINHGSTRALIDRIVPSPDMTWPMLGALNLLVFEEQAKGNWGFIAETLFNDWPRRRIDLLDHHFDGDEEFKIAMVKSLQDMAWRESVKPLVESLIKTNRVEDAEAVILSIAKDDLYKDIARMAADLALSLGRQDLQTKWLALKVPEKNKPDMDDLALSLHSYSSIPRLVITNGTDFDKEQIDAMLKQGQLIDWRLANIQLSPEMSEFLRQKEGWPENETRWALFHKNKLLADAPGLPTQATLVQELELSGMQTLANARKRFISANPSHLTAKEGLVRELKRVAELKTIEKLGDDARTNTECMLLDEDNQAIWGEYAALYRQTFQYFIEQGRPQWTWVNAPFESGFFMHSQIMKLLARSFLPPLEAHLKRQPADSFLWGAWAALSDLNENISFKNFAETLALSPFDYSPLDNLPPYDVRRSLLWRYRSKSSWQRIIDIQEWRWEAMLNYFEHNPAKLEQHFWEQDIWHLLEAYLRLDKARDANELITIWSQSPNWQNIKQSAVEFAEECGKVTLAEQWGKL